MRSFPIIIGIIAAYHAVRLIPRDFARLASEFYFDQPVKNHFFNNLIELLRAINLQEPLFHQWYVCRKFKSQHGIDLVFKLQVACGLYIAQHLAEFGHI